MIFSALSRELPVHLPVFLVPFFRHFLFLIFRNKWCIVLSFYPTSPCEDFIPSFLFLTVSSDWVSFYFHVFAWVAPVHLFWYPWRDRSSKKPSWTSYPHMALSSVVLHHTLPTIVRGCYHNHLRSSTYLLFHLPHKTMSSARTRNSYSSALDSSA